MGKSIKSVSDFLEKIEKAIKSKETIFYRGHSDKSYSLEPSIFRKDIYI